MGKIDKKKRIILQIKAGDLIEEHCRECGMNGKGKADYCKTKCEIGIALEKIGLELVGDKEEKRKHQTVNPHETEEGRIKILKQAKKLIAGGMTKEGSAKQLGILPSSLWEWEKKYNFNLGGKKKKTFSEDERIEILKKAVVLAEKGMSKRNAALEVGIHIVTLLDWERKFNIYLPYAVEKNCRERLNKADELMRNGMTKRGAAKEIGVNESTLRMWEKKYNFKLQGKSCIQGSAGGY